MLQRLVAFAMFGFVAACSPSDDTAERDTADVTEDASDALPAPADASADSADAAARDVARDAVDAAHDVEPDVPWEPPCPLQDAPEFDTVVQIENGAGDDPRGGAVSDLIAADIDGDDAVEYVYVDIAREQIGALDGCEDACRDVVLATVTGAPGRVRAADMDGDGTVELVVAGVGGTGQTNAPVGSVVVLERVAGQWRQRARWDDLYRVSCVEPADVDGDGRLDLIVCEFGFTEGQLSVYWGGPDGFEPDVIYERPGTVGVVVLDTDGDGDDDIVAAVSQDQEEMVALEHDGSRGFARRVLHVGGSPAWGLSSIARADLNVDGRPDIVFTNGDPDDVTTDDLAARLHGLDVLWNRGGGRFAFERLADQDFAQAMAIADFDGDCVDDVMVFSAPSFSAGLFDVEGIDIMPRLVRPMRAPDERVTLIPDGPVDVTGATVGDLNGDGRPDVLAGQIYSAYPDRPGLIYAVQNLPAD